MLAIFSDTHSTRGHELEGAALVAARDADAVIHAGDFTTIAALEAFPEVCPRFHAVHGNADTPAVIDRLPSERVVDHDGVRIAVTHHRNGGETGLAMFGRSLDADVVISGHTHQPGIRETDEILLINPGSHAQPRGNRPGFATLEVTGAGLTGSLRQPDETVLESIDVDR